MLRWAVLLFSAGTLLAQYGAPRVLAEVSIKGLTESSGIAASRAHPGVFWSHNDSSGGAYLYAFDRAGKSVGRWRVAGARAWDWEDIAVGPGPERGSEYIYIGDIGDNNRNRKQIVVYRIEAPARTATAALQATAISLAYPDGPHDAEALLVHPSTGDIYVVTKARGKDENTMVFKAAAPHSASRRKMTHAGNIDLPGMSPISLIIGRITGGDISPDGTRVVLCDYFRAYEAVLPTGKKFDSIWSGAPWRDVGIGQRKQGEGCCYRHDGRAILATSEGREFPLLEVERK